MTNSQKAQSVKGQQGSAVSDSAHKAQQQQAHRSAATQEFGVPGEYDGMTDITGGSHAAISNVPWYITRARKDLSSANYVREKQDSPDSVAQLAAVKHLDENQKAADKPLRGVPKGTTVNQVNCFCKYVLLRSVGQGRAGYFV